ncbi:MAG: TRCF domain-containing protein, partial [Bacteroidota bacterium]
SLTQDAKKRLRAMEEFSDLGSGFHIALRDLDIRGAGDLLGPEQSGFIHEIGYDMYHKILDEAIRELKEEHFAALFPEEANRRKEILAEDCKIDLDLDIRMPEVYVPSIPERLKFYRRIAGAEKEEDLRDIQREMIDRFGPMPSSVLALFDATRIREKARRVGLERVVLKNKVLRLYFISDQESSFFESKTFSRALEYVQTFSAKVKIKQSPKYLSLIFDSVEGIKDVLSRVTELYDFVHFVPEEELETES